MVTQTVVDPETGEEKVVEVGEAGEQSPSGTPPSDAGVGDKVPLDNREKESLRRLEKVKEMESQVEIKLQELNQLVENTRKQQATPVQRKEVKQILSELQQLTGEGTYLTPEVMSKITELSETLAEEKIRPLREFTLETGMHILRNARENIISKLKSANPKIARFEKEIGVALDNISPIYWKNEEAVKLIASKVLADNMDVLLKEAGKTEDKVPIPPVEPPAGTPKGKTGVTVSEKEAEQLAINEDISIEKAREVIAAKNKKLKELKETGGK